MLEKVAQTIPGTVVCFILSTIYHVSLALEILQHFKGAFVGRDGVVWVVCKAQVVGTAAVVGEEAASSKPAVEEFCSLRTTACGSAPADICDPSSSSSSGGSHTSWTYTYYSIVIQQESLIVSVPFYVL